MKLSNLEIAAIQGCHLGKLRQVPEEYSANIMGEKNVSLQKAGIGGREEVYCFFLL